MEENYLSALALFDEQSTERIARLKATLCEFGVACDLLPPHITLGAYVGLPPAPLIEWTGQFARARQWLPVQFNHIGLFGEKVCFVAPRVDEGLLALHRDFHEKFDENSGEVGYNYTLRSNNWTPHCTLYLGEVTDTRRVLPVMLQNFAPFSGFVSRIAVGQSVPIEQLAVFDMQRPNEGRPE